MKPFVFSYSRHSKSAKALAKELNAVFSYPNKGDAPPPGATVITWGSSFQAPWHWQVGKIFNRPEAVKRAVNKLTTFELLRNQGLPIPTYTTNHEQAYLWIEAQNIVYARELLTGRKGEGVDIYDLNSQKGRKVTLEELEHYKMFTKYFPAHWEFKVHVINGKVDHVIRVGRDDDFAQDPYIRNHANGWTFYDELRPLHPDIKDACIKAVKALGLDFGIVDIGVGKGYGQMCIYEVNTAPGGEAEDARIYAKAFLREYGIQRGD